MNAVEVIVAGHICLDVFPTLAGGTALFRPGRTVEAGPVLFSTGGPVSNTGLALHKLGAATRLMGKVGDDLFGHAILDIIASSGPGLTDGMVIAPGEASSYSIILSPPNADRMFIHASGCNDTFGAEDVSYDLLEDARLFHFGYPPLMKRMYTNNGIELAAMLWCVKALGLTTSLDLAQPDPLSEAGQADWRAILGSTLPHVDVFSPSIEEMLLMLRRPLFDRIASGEQPIDHITPTLVSEIGQELLEMGAKIVALKLGVQGLYLRTTNVARLANVGRCQVDDLIAWADRELWSPCFTAQVAGTTGAGDATIAGLLLGLLRGMSPYDTLTAACAVGACSVEAVDATSAVRTWPETQA
ncbi:MAG TPA: carbohydrate kinase family protein, partial [Ktedonobacteraceae bacterium]|nr:carbohydrate kinase family protein [Ktedonobacteraceae bacterium]